MNKLIEAAEIALEAMDLHVETYPHMDKWYMVDARSELRQALEEPADSTTEVVDTETPICTPQYTEMLRLRKQEAIESCARLTMSSDDWLAETIAVAATWQTDQEGRFIGAGINPDLAIHIARFILEVKAKQGTKQEPVGYADKYDLEREGHDFWVSRQEGKHTVPLYATQPEQEPITLKVYQGEICYMSQDDDQSFGMWCPVNYDTDHGFPNETKFYTESPKREWVGLTDEDIYKAKTLLTANDPEYAIFFIMTRLQEYNT